MRHLLELLDGAVAREYERAGISYRPRYFPVMQALLVEGSLSVTQIAKAAGITQPAATQTIALMMQEGLLESDSSQQDGRQRLITLTEQGRSLLPRLDESWAAVTAAAKRLDSELTFPLSEILENATQALDRKSFDARIADARRTKRSKSTAAEKQARYLHSAGHGDQRRSARKQGEAR